MEIETLTPEQFPELLMEIPDKPKKLYIKGKFPTEGVKFLCAVGSRRYSAYGKEAAEKLIAGLRGFNITIISGLALGIDSIVHRAALENGLNTIAIPGSGLGRNVLYPSANRNLADRIIEAGGALISEFEENFRATQYSFPQRNRIMAGMSHAVFIVEAEEKSGTLITARLATEYNRDVLTVPGPIFSKNSYGPHMLIRLGAIPVTKSEDILEALGIKAEEKEKVNLENLSENEIRVVEILKSPLPRDELVARLNIPIQEANVILSAMELKGLITERLGEIRLS